MPGPKRRNVESLGISMTFEEAHNKGKIDVSLGQKQEMMGAWAYPWSLKRHGLKERSDVGLGLSMTF